MFYEYHPPASVTDETIGRMKKAGIIHNDAKLNQKAEKNLRKEVAFSDIDFMDYLAKTSLEEECVDGALNILKEKGLISNTQYDKDHFLWLRKTVKNKFEGSWSSFSPTMERLLYALTSVRKPKSLYEFGCFWGNTLAWFCGPYLQPDCTGNIAEYIGACDIDKESLELAKKNFDNTFPGHNVDIRCIDGMKIIDELTPPIEFVYLEAKSPGQKAIYLDLLQKIYDKLPDGAWVIAHDTTRYTMFAEFVEYLDFVRDERNFKASISLDVDQYGLELTIK